MINNINNVKIVVTLPTKKVEILPENIIDGSIRLDKYAMQGESLQYGTAITSQFDFICVDPLGIDWRSVKYLEYIVDGKLLFKGFVEYTKKTDDTRRITCYDALAKLDDEVTLAEYAIFLGRTGQSSPKDFVENLLNYVSNKVGYNTGAVTFKLPSMPIVGQIDSSFPAEEKLTIRQVLSYALEMLGAVVFVENGGFVVKSITNTTKTFRSNLIYAPLVIDEFDVNLTGVIYELGVANDSDNATDPDYVIEERFVGDSKERVIYLRDNPLQELTTPALFAESIYERDKHFSWRPANIQVDFSRVDEIELMDLIKVVDRDGVEFKVLVTSISYTHGSRVIVSSVGENWRSDTNALATSSGRKAYRVRRDLSNRLEAVKTEADNARENYVKDKEKLADDLLDLEDKALNSPVTETRITDNAIKTSHLQANAVRADALFVDGAMIDKLVAEKAFVDTIWGKFAYFDVGVMDLLQTQRIYDTSGNFWDLSTGEWQNSSVTTEISNQVEPVTTQLGTVSSEVAGLKQTTVSKTEFDSYKGTVDKKIADITITPETIEMTVSSTVTTYVNENKELLKGDKGDKGNDGKSSYTHIRYSPYPDGRNTTLEPQSNTNYMGIAVTDSPTAPGSDKLHLYKWSLIVKEVDYDSIVDRSVSGVINKGGFVTVSSLSGTYGITNGTISAITERVGKVEIKSNSIEATLEQKGKYRNLIPNSDWFSDSTAFVPEDKRRDTLAKDNGTLELIIAPNSPVGVYYFYIPLNGETRGETHDAPRGYTLIAQNRKGGNNKFWGYGGVDNNRESITMGVSCIKGGSITPYTDSHYMPDGDSVRFTVLSENASLSGTYLRIGVNLKRRTSVASGVTLYPETLALIEGRYSGVTYDMTYPGNASAYIKMRIDDSISNISLKADQIKLEGYTTINNGFSIDNSGNMTARNADITGKVTATNGIIGGFTIGDGILYGGSGTSYIRLSGHPNFDPILAGGSRWSTAKFAVANTGSMKATQANITGTIHAESGSIGGMSIQDGYLEAGSGSSYIRIAGRSGFAPFLAGGNNWNSATFKVSSAGKLVAVDATIEGTITAGSGSIGGFTLTSGQIRGSRIRFNSGSSYSGLIASATENGTSVTSLSSIGRFSGSNGSYSGSSSGSARFSSGSYTGSGSFSSGTTIAGHSLSSSSGGLYSSTLSATNVYFINLNSTERDSTGRTYSARLFEGRWIISNSDIRLKENIETLGDEYNEYIYNMPVMSYNYKGSKRNSVGMIANYLDNTLPKEMSESFINRDETTDMYGINYELIVPYLIKVVQDLNNRLKEVEHGRDSVNDNKKA